MSVCCWPCVCDLQEFVKADTLEVDTREGRTTLDVLVIGEVFLQSHIYNVGTAVFVQVTPVFNLREYLDELPKFVVSMVGLKGRHALLGTTW